MGGGKCFTIELRCCCYDFWLLHPMSVGGKKRHTERLMLSKVLSQPPTATAAVSKMQLALCKSPCLKRGQFMGVYVLGWYEVIIGGWLKLWNEINALLERSDSFVFPECK